MIEIIPAILPATYDEIVRDVSLVHSLTPNVQVDFCDGKYVPNKTWWFNGKGEAMLEALLREEDGLPMWNSINYDFDLMVQDPLKHIDTFVALGPSRIIFHAGSVIIAELQAWLEALPEITKQMIQFGIALRTQDDPKIIAPLIPFINIIQIMGVAHIGYQGEQFDTKVYEYIAEVKKLYAGVLIAVDGGIKLENAAELVKRGVSRLIVGSLIFKSMSPKDTIDELNNICESVAVTL